VRLGPLDVFLPALLKPAAQRWRAALLAVRSGSPMPLLPAAGASVLGADADPRGAALAYRRLGREWLRIDLADRLASHARKVRSAGGDDPVDAALATSLGLGEEAIARLMGEVGFARAGDAWRWRGRRGPQPDRRAAPSHAFAELAKLRKT
jgi:ATP-dependent RNA helicase SUPV3L1/SUV3